MRRTLLALVSSVIVVATTTVSAENQCPIDPQTEDKAPSSTPSEKKPKQLESAPEFLWDGLDRKAVLEYQRRELMGNQRKMRE